MISVSFRLVLLALVFMALSCGSPEAPTGSDEPDATTDADADSGAGVDSLEYILPDLDIYKPDGDVSPDEVPEEVTPVEFDVEVQADVDCCDGDVPEDEEITDVLSDETSVELPDEVTEVDEVETEQVLDCEAGDGGFLCPCTDDDECASGYCVDTSDGRVCSEPCQGECEGEGWVCAEVAETCPDCEYICVWPFADLCRPCTEHGQCPGPLGLGNGGCVDYGPGGAFCGAACEQDFLCPEGYECLETGLIGGVVATQCVRTVGDCGCSPAAIAAGAQTVCHVENSFGSCQGLRICAEGGLGSCTAAIPAPETCNGLDDDCDGSTDEEHIDTSCMIENELGSCPGHLRCEAGVGICEGEAARAEICNGSDDNCDGQTDEGYEDSDSDGQMDCVDPDDDNDGVLDDGDGSGVVGDAPCAEGQTLDCDDNCLLSQNPDQTDTDGDGIGDFCDCDRDGDGYDTYSCFGFDCDDLDADRNPGVVEVPATAFDCTWCNDIDDDCDGTTDEGCIDSDDDGLVDCLDPDDDNDGVPDDGDDSGTAGDVPCDSGLSVGCDDNCPRTSNGGQVDTDNDGLGDACDPDLDGDGRLNESDNCPDLRNPGQTDNDSDGLGDACDPDDDNDVVMDVDDNCPLVANPLDPQSGLQPDLDEDGLGDACDIDMDNDGLFNFDDNCEATPNPQQEDVDDDGVGDACDEDRDNDGIDDDGDSSGTDGDAPCTSGATVGCDDNCPLVVNGDQLDSDGDGEGDACDEDDDDDGVLDDGGGLVEGSEDDQPCVHLQTVGCDDNCRLIANDDQENLDNDGLGDACDDDKDGDGYPAIGEGGTDCADLDANVNPGVDETQISAADCALCNGVDDDCDGDTDEGCFDVDQNETPDCMEHDSDGDTVPDGADNCVQVGNPNQKDLDGDGVGDLCDDDKDGDGATSVAAGGGDCVDTDASIHPSAAEICDGRDNNCNDQVDEGFLNTDGDDEADCVDGDDDADSVLDDDDNCPLVSNTAQADLDEDGLGDACDTDDDSDGVLDTDDNCPLIANKDQGNADDDALGDVCDPDDDNDTFADGADNCPLIANVDQADLDGDSLGDVCDDDADGDGDPGVSDCDDMDAALYHGAAELCDGINNDCDALIDEEGSVGCQPYLLDGDGDGYGVFGDGKCLCGPDPNTHYTAASAGDCNDGDATVNPGRVEICNDKNDNCVGGADEGCDDDNDDYCDSSLEIVGSPTTCSKGGGDCDDGDANVRPEALEACDDQDNNCDLEVDEGCDDDGDGFCDAALVVAGAPAVCSGGTQDCDDEDETIYPGAGELCDGIDNDCDDVIDGDDAGDLILGGLELCEIQAGACDGAPKPISLCVEGAWLPCEAGHYAQHSPHYTAGSEALCDGVDNDCDGSTDEDFSVTLSDGTVVDGAGEPCSTGACGGGTTICREDQGGILCTQETGTSLELCDGVDNDCDGKTDSEDSLDLLNNDAQACEMQDGVCLSAMKPAALCVDGEWLPCDTLVYSGHNALYQPGQEIECDGFDNDCDGEKDEDFTKTMSDGQIVVGTGQDCGAGGCAGGVSQCLPTKWGIMCSTEALARPETCNMVDDDCDGKTDSADPDLSIKDPQLCGNQSGVCKSATKSGDLCVNGAWLECNEATYDAYSEDYQGVQEQSCDGLDNDCDGTADEDFTSVTPDGATVAGVGKTCGLGVCSGGLTVCRADGSGTECSTADISSPEVCDGSDNDCDGMTDASDASLFDDGAPPCELSEGVCAGASKPASLCVQGVWRACDAGVYQAQVDGYDEATELHCDALDNDCDGETDEDFSLTLPDGTELSGLGASCNAGECGAGVTVCSSDASGIECSDGTGPVPEICDGEDNDCDGLTDAEDPDLAANDPQSCEKTAGVCAGLTKPAALCQGGVWTPCDEERYQSYSADYEGERETSCDAKDNDCDGVSDEDFSMTTEDGALLGGVGQACGVGACAGGATVCTDEGDAIECSTAWKRGPELCNGNDDDCDGRPDEIDGDVSLADATPCQKQLGVCAGSVTPPQRCVDGSWRLCEEGDYLSAIDTYESGEEHRCDGLDNDCDGAADEDFSLISPDGAVIVGPGVDCGVGRCQGGVSRCTDDAESLECSSDDRIADETCNQIDDDCDGLVDGLDGLDLSLNDPRSCEIQAGVCLNAAKPPHLCVDGVWAPCDDAVYGDYQDNFEAGAELSCDGLDNDCDGATDDDFSLVLLDGSTAVGTGVPCGTGQCIGGYTACRDDDAGIECAVEAGADAEICDGLDNDCDGLVDGEDPDLLTEDPQFCENVDGVCGSTLKPASLCVTGSWRTCTDDTYAAQIEFFEFGAETRCDGLDNDCDGDTDEDFSLTTEDGGVVSGVGVVCGVGACAGGTTACDAQGTGIQCSSYDLLSTEICDNIDNDCDGLTDGSDPEDLLDADSQDCEQQLGVCAGATKPVALCVEGAWEPCGSAVYLANNPNFDEGVEEYCDNFDNDCNGETDEDFSFVDGAGDTVTGIYAPCGTGRCANGYSVCNLYATGTRCSTADLKALEVCNSIDDDCDGSTDALDEADILQHDGQLCENMQGVCQGATKPAALCVNGLWEPCGNDAYLAHSDLFEGGVELSCDGYDNDCNSATDEDFSITLLDGSIATGTGVPCGSGSCGVGLTICNAAGSDVVCSTDVGVQPERCNGVDDDCDGLTDSADDDLLANDAKPCENQDGVCEGAMKPAALCIEGSWRPCKTSHYTTHADAYEEGVEVSCDGIDNDCSGSVDEDFEIELLDGSLAHGVGAACGVGACAGGTTVCALNGSGITCPSEATASPETCNSIDDDCDGLSDSVDAADLALFDPQDCEHQLGVCVGSTKPIGLCQGGTWLACGEPEYVANDIWYQTAKEGFCDARDNDCDGATDEDFELTTPDGVTYQGVGDTCGSGACADGEVVCTPNWKATRCSSDNEIGDEVCNGKDDDCDGYTDADDEDAIDTNGFFHDDMPACENNTTICGGAVHHAALCEDGIWLSCDAVAYTKHDSRYEAPMERSCDGIDNDCDGSSDEDFSIEMQDGTLIVGVKKSCGVGQCEGGITSCASDDLDIVCSSYDWASDEVCDSIDNDCDGKTDLEDEADLLLHDRRLCENQDGVCALSQKPATLCQGGAWDSCDDSSYAAHSADFEYGEELSCDGLDNDCNGMTDEDFPLVLLDNRHVMGIGQACGTGLCASGTTVCDPLGLGIVCPTEELSDLEICNGLDDDCDGRTDTEDGADLEAADIQACEKDAGVCAGSIKPTWLCVTGAWAECPESIYVSHSAEYNPGQEGACDGIDNNCDGNSDEGFSLVLLTGETVLGTGVACGVGACATEDEGDPDGYTACTADENGIVCAAETAASSEVCNGIDDDCDGLTDADDPDLLDNDLRLCELQTGVCAGATKPAGLCVDGAWEPCGAGTYDGHNALYEHELELTCDAIDNDCDSGTDEDFTLADFAPGGAAVILTGPGVACGAGACAGETTRCNAEATGLMCPGHANQGDEVCNNTDDDCDGLVDAEDPVDLIANDQPACEKLHGVCAGALKTAAQCVNGGWQVCNAAAYAAHDEDYEEDVELHCDGLDNDCDDDVDEDFQAVIADGTSVSGVGEPCGAGACAGGVTVCLDDESGTACDSEDLISPELCNGLDDDCDGRTDLDDLADLTANDTPLCEDQQGVCEGASKPSRLCTGTAAGWSECDAEVYRSHAIPEGGGDTLYDVADEATCDGLDNNCDGTADEAFSVLLLTGEEVNGTGVACGVGACQIEDITDPRGYTQCTDDGLAIVCTAEDVASPELCSGADDDCDGFTDGDDPGLLASDGQSCELSAGVCSGASKPASLCVDGQWLDCAAAIYTAYNGNYEAGAEASCDNLDNNCNGSTDDDFEWVHPTSGEVLGIHDDCGVGSCSGGKLGCNPAGDGLRCSSEDLAQDEMCDGVDNDCDGLVDGDDPDIETHDAPPCETQVGVCLGATKPRSLCVEADWLACSDAHYLAWADTYEAGTELHCDGLDNDCDGEEDDDFEMTTLSGAVISGVGVTCGDGECVGGSTACRLDGLGVECPTESNQANEICDDKDNDCDGFADASDPDLLVHDLQACEKGQGVCEGSTKPASLCNAGVWGACTSQTYRDHDEHYLDGEEISCDGYDNNCSGDADEAFTLELLTGEVVTGTGVPCGVGACAIAEPSNVNGYTQCTDAADAIWCPAQDAASPELCDGIDNDCDGLTDAADPDLVVNAPQACALHLGVCSGVIKPAALCVEGAWLECTTPVYLAHDDSYEAGFELSCDGLDNDCDGSPDDDFTLNMPDGSTVSGVNTSCGVGACAGGQTACAADGTSITCSTTDNGGPELCNGQDDDCDGIPDAEDADIMQDDPQACENSEGVCAGSIKPARLCTGSGWLGCDDAAYLSHSADFEAGVELHCDSLDNDCDGDTDEDFSLIMPDGTPHSGVGVDCGLGACAGGTTICSPDGWTSITCSTLSKLEAEVCDNADNDCDGLVDADDLDLVLKACGVQLGVCEGSTSGPDLCISGAWAECDTADYLAHDDDFDPDEETSCDGLDNNCNGIADDSFHLELRNGDMAIGTGQPCGAGVCELDEANPEGYTRCTEDGNGMYCPAEDLASPELCDGLDNDCDGAVDASDTDDVVNGHFPQDAPLCELQSSGCAGLTKPAVLCEQGAWTACGTLQYASYFPAYESGDETSCDEQDNDCDGSTDEDFSVTTLTGELLVGKGLACGAGACADGLTACDPTTHTLACTNESLATMETCNYEDDDCDGATDEDFSLTTPDGVLHTGSGKACGVGACAQGTTSCASAGALTCSTLGAISNEVCDGVDNDCDGLLDVADAEDLLLHDTQLCERQIGPCEGAKKPIALCEGGGWSACTDAVYLAHHAGYDGIVEARCDGQDNDCDGSVDEDFSVMSGGSPVAGIGKACGNPACGEGLTACKDDETGTYCEGAVQPETEVCDNVDNNCDGVIDDGCDDDGDSRCDANMLVSGDVVSVDLCPSSPTGQAGDDCDDSNAWIGPVATEYCDGLDNNCDGVADDAAANALSLCETAYNGAAGVPLTCAGGNGTPDEFVPYTGAEGDGWQCNIVACAAGTSNADGLHANGCECSSVDLSTQQFGGPWDTPGTCASAFYLGELLDDVGGGDELSVTGIISDDQDEDWYRVVFTDQNDGATLANNFSAWVKLTGDQGGRAVVDIYEFTGTPDCGAITLGSPTCAVDANDEGYQWSVKGTNASGGEAPCQRETRVCFASGIDECSDECCIADPRVPDANAPNTATLDDDMIDFDIEECNGCELAGIDGNYCNKDTRYGGEVLYSRTVYIRVRAASAGAVGCSEYSLHVSNNLMPLGTGF